MFSAHFQIVKWGLGKFEEQAAGHGTPPTKHVHSRHLNAEGTNGTNRELVGTKGRARKW